MVQKGGTSEKKKKKKKKIDDDWGSYPHDFSETAHDFVNLFHQSCWDFAMAEPAFDVTPVAAAGMAVWLLVFVWRSWKLLRRRIFNGLIMGESWNICRILWDHFWRIYIYNIEYDDICRYDVMGTMFDYTRMGYN